MHMLIKYPSQILSLLAERESFFCPPILSVTGWTEQDVWVDLFFNNAYLNIHAKILFLLAEIGKKDIDLHQFIAYISSNINTGIP